MPPPELALDDETVNSAAYGAGVTLVLPNAPGAGCCCRAPRVDMKGAPGTALLSDWRLADRVLGKGGSGRLRGPWRPCVTRSAGPT
jgi:hypothetical protein